MSKLIHLYVTETHHSVTVANGASRQTSASTLTEMLQAMQEDDARALYALADSVCKILGARMVAPVAGDVLRRHALPGGGRS